MNPTASIIIPTYYRNQRLLGAIRSARHQTYSPVEIVVVDDSGEEHARSVVEDLENVQYVAHDTNRGAPTARVTGFEHSTGRYIQMLDDDDTIDRKKIEKQVHKLEQPDVGVVYCGFDLNGEEWYPRYKGDVLQQALTFRLTPCSIHTMLVERELYDQIMPFDPYVCLHDLHLCIEFAQRTKFDYVDEILARYDRPAYRYEAIETFDRLIEDNIEVYRKQPDHVLRRAKANAARKKGHAYLSEKRWSLNATKCYLEAFRYSPDHEVEYLLRALFSLLGRPGRDYGMNAFRRIVSTNG